MCNYWLWPKHAFHLQQNHQESSNKGAWGWPRGVWGVLKPDACREVQRQLSIVVNANTHLHNGKINGALWGINLHRVRPACLFLGWTIWGRGSWLKWETFTRSFFFYWLFKTVSWSNTLFDSVNPCPPNWIPTTRKSWQTTDLNKPFINVLTQWINPLMHDVCIITQCTCRSTNNKKC